MSFQQTTRSKLPAHPLDVHFKKRYACIAPSPKPILREAHRQCASGSLPPSPPSVRILSRRAGAAMPLVVYGYDLICFAIVASAICGSIWAIQRRECRRCSNESKYESLLADGSDGELFVGPTQMGHVGSSLLWMSCWKGVHPAWLLALRALSGIVMAGFLIWDITRYGSSIFVYYTEWTFTLVIIYFGLGTIVSAHGCWMYSKYNMENEEKGGGSWKTDTEDGISAATSYETVTVRSTIKLQSDCNKEMIKQRAGFWGYLMQIVYQTSAGAMMLTNIVFWCLIVPFLSIKHFSLNLLMGCMHTLNAVFLLLDTALNSMTFPSFRLAYFVLWSCIYIIFQWVLHMCGFSCICSQENKHK